MGGITLEELTLHLGYIPPIKNKEAQTVASGMVKHHYAPETPLSFYHPESPVDANAAYIFYKETFLYREGNLVFCLLHYIQSLPQNGRLFFETILLLRDSKEN